MRAVLYAKYVKTKIFYTRRPTFAVSVENFACTCYYNTGMQFPCGIYHIFTHLTLSHHSIKYSGINKRGLVEQINYTPNCSILKLLFFKQCFSANLYIFGRYYLFFIDILLGKFFFGFFLTFLHNVYKV